MKYPILNAIFVGLASAWLPSDVVANTKSPSRLHARHLPTRSRLQSSDGSSLFKRQDTGTPASAIPKPIRGVNLGSLFVFEPWIDKQHWESLGCGDTKSEFDCGRAFGRDEASEAFQTKHWNSYYTQDDFLQMKAAGLNAVRVPVGYWMWDEVVDGDSEPFPQGGFKFLQEVCGWASDQGMYIIVDMHGAPGAQAKNNALTGQINPNADFFETHNYDRATRFLGWITEQIHKMREFRNVGMLEVLNEPDRGHEDVNSKFYPQAYKAIRDAETKAKVQESDQLHVQFMDESWGNGDPLGSLPNLSKVAVDDHRYLKYDDRVDQTPEGYMKTSCDDARNSGKSDVPVIVGEFSLSPSDDVEKDPDWDPVAKKDWYLGWFSAQARSYEKSSQGWIFWTWKSALDDPRWSFRDAQTVGLIPKDLQDVEANANKACGQ